jgi:hypothetical protein
MTRHVAVIPTNKRSSVSMGIPSLLSDIAFSIGAASGLDLAKSRLMRGKSQANISQSGSEGAVALLPMTAIALSSR